MNQIHQRIGALRHWLETGDPQLEPEWSDRDLHTMEREGTSPKDYARQLIENYDWIRTGE